MIDEEAQVLKKISLVGIAALVWGTALPSTAQEPKVVATQLLPIGIQLGHLREFVAKSVGFYDEEGVDIRLEPALGSALQIQYMTAGRGTVGSTDMHMLLAQRRQPSGLKARAVYSYLQSGVFRFGMLDETPIKRPADLKGKKVGVPTRASGSFDFLRTVGKLAGVQEADMEIIPVGFGPAAADAVIRKRIDLLATTFNDFNNMRYLSEQQGRFKLRELRVPQNAYPTNAFIVTDEDLKNKRKLVVGMLRAFAKGHVFFIESPLAALMSAKKLFPELVRNDDIDRQIVLAKWGIEETYDIPKYRDKPLGYFDMEAWTGTEEYYRQAGLIEPNDKIADVIDTSLLEEVNNFDKERIRKMAREYK